MNHITVSAILIIDENFSAVIYTSLIEVSVSSFPDDRKLLGTFRTEIWKKSKSRAARHRQTGR